jgi:hypothetical protein
MWTRKDIREFKESISKEGKDSIIKVGHGETVTVSFFFSFFLKQHKIKMKHLLTQVENCEI